MTHSGLADSPLFNNPGSPHTPNHENIQENKPIQGNHQDTMPPSHHDDRIESVRKAVKVIGKEAATYRLTKKEKQALLEIIFAYRLKGVKVSENAIARIAINYFINDFKTNPTNSILQAVIDALNQ